MGGNKKRVEGGLAGGLTGGSKSGGVFKRRPAGKRWGYVKKKLVMAVSSPPKK
jgi:hypothetical protein